MSLDSEVVGNDDAWSEAIRRRSETVSAATAASLEPGSWGGFAAQEAFSTENAVNDDGLAQGASASQQWSDTWSDADWSRWNSNNSWYNNYGGWRTQSNNGGGNSNKERVNAPSYDGLPEDRNKPGSGPRNYLRKLEAWENLTNTLENERATTVYYKLEGQAWEDADSLDTSLLATDSGMEYFKEWLQRTYLEQGILKVGQVLRGFYKDFKRDRSKDIKAYNMEFDKHIKEMEKIGGAMSEPMKAWWYIDKMHISEHHELTLLTTAMNKYELQPLKEAAIVQDRKTSRFGKWGR